MNYPYDELDKLERMLFDARIPFIRRKKEFKSLPYSYWEQICYIPDGKVLSDAIVTSKNPNNLLEQYGLLWFNGKSCRVKDLTAEQVFESWKKDWDARRKDESD